MKTPRENIEAALAYVADHYAQIDLDTMTRPPLPGWEPKKITRAEEAEERGRINGLAIALLVMDEDGHINPNPSVVGAIYLTAVHEAKLRIEAQS